MTNSDSADPLPTQRHLFDIPDDVAFLNCAYISPLPKASVEAGERGLRRKSRPWTIVPDDFFTASEAVRTRFAKLINASADDIAFAPAVMSFANSVRTASLAVKKSSGTMVHG